MRKFVIIFLSLFVIGSCDKLKSLDLFTKKEERKEPIVASVGQTNLYLSELAGVIPRGISRNDSIVLAKSYINTWAKQQLLLQKAEENISEVNSKKIDDLIKTYRQSLYINGYKESLIKQQLDTIVTEEAILTYYENNKENFKLNEELLQIKYVYFGNDFLDKKEAIEKFKSEEEEDLEDLESLTINFKDYQLRDSSWTTYDNVLQKIPPFRYEAKENLLKKSKFIKREDSLGVYLVAVNDVLLRNDIAPLSYIENNIKQLILHKRKIELVRDIEKTLINDAIKNNEFKEY
ncbi:hypothetical protein EV195_10397 [Tenacibaculum skagerrakense]|uniref:Peptidyl-prolyl cis-trans isomerase n=1 Tax=Tenacibaculum skagerrakense TaxID=186571 RepID=A0A4R2NVW3_9FLAO|nr:hypothetical protein [Tenacibaculum skagerrakense]TCP25738.1 hypothetical protein EV195_10397 [Tenacibaculum skagerrakense]